MHSSRQIWEETTKRLEKKYSQREAENISYLLLEDLSGMSRSAIVLNEPLQIDRSRLDESLKRILQGEPVQYVMGEVEFYGRRFRVEPGVLIPRPETEELCQLIIDENTIENPRILEVGVGSGCIITTLCRSLEGMAYGTDISPEALRIARQNAKCNGTEITFFQHDALNSDFPVKDLDILVSNPPYIPQSDAKSMQSNVLDYEPAIALFVPDQEPLIFYNEIALKGLKALKNGGQLYFEIHENFGDEVLDVLARMGYAERKIHQDMQGKPRMVSGRLK